MRNNHDTDDEEEDDIVPDGGVVRVGVMHLDSLDSTQQSVARSWYDAHRPGFRYADNTDARDAAEQSRNSYVEWLRDAHRTHVRTLLVDASEPERPVSRQRGLDAAKREAERAYSEMCQYLRDAHRGGRP